VADVTLTEAEDGAHVTVQVGDVISVSLPENSAAGYRWTVASLDGTRIDVERHGYQSASDAVGSAGAAVWKLSARSAGRTRLEFVKSRSWEPATAASQRFAVDLDVRD
jgi:predicted secreted protein